MGSHLRSSFRLRLGFRLRLSYAGQVGEQAVHVFMQKGTVAHWELEQVGAFCLFAGPKRKRFGCGKRRCAVCVNQTFSQLVCKTRAARSSSGNLRFGFKKGNQVLRLGGSAYGTSTKNQDRRTTRRSLSKLPASL